MIFLSNKIVILLTITYSVESKRCDMESCPQEDKQMVCGYDMDGKEYKMFPNQCVMSRYTACYEIDLVKVDITYCIKNDLSQSRRAYDIDESCPVFCADYYRPVCGASKIKNYVYRTFINQCYLDMLNCRGDEDVSGYVEVPLKFCQRHPMKNIFKEKIVMTNYRDYVDNF